jgi:pilus assembly protein CpaB
MRSKTAVLLSGFVGVLALVLLWVYISNREAQLLEQSAPKPVVVATADILENTVIDESKLTAIRVPAKYLQPRAISDPRDAIGRVAVVPVPRGAQLLATYLQDLGQTALANEVPTGRRALTMAVNDVTGVAGLLRPGNFVDVFGTFEFGRPVSSQGGRIQYADERTETRLLLQNLQVVAVERQHLHAREEARAEQAAGTMAEQARAEQRQTQASRQITNVTLLVGPAEAQQLILAQEIGTLTLALRSNLDTGRAVDLGSLDPLMLLKVPVPIKPRATPVWREIRGGGAPPIF